MTCNAGQYQLPEVVKRPNPSLPSDEVVFSFRQGKQEKREGVCLMANDRGFFDV